MQIRGTTKPFIITALATACSVLFLCQSAFAATQGVWPSTAAPSDIVVANTVATEDTQYITQTSDGDYIVAYGLTGRSYVQKFSAADGSAVAAWNGGTPIIALFDAPTAIIPDTSGGAYVATNMDFGGGVCAIFIQRLDSTGTIQFPFGGLNVTNGLGTCESFMQMIPDGSGGFYMAWGDGGPNPDTSLTRELYITRVTSGGVVDPTWNVAGGGPFRHVQFPESVPGARENSAHIVDDGAGNVVAVYESSLLAFYFAATKFSSIGVMAGAPWSTPLEIDANGNGNLGRHLIADGSGGVIVGFASGPFGSPTSVEAQRIDSAGALQWGTGVIASSTNIDGYIGQPRIASDGSGGAIIGWHTAGGATDDIYAHHITSAGALDATGNWAAAPIALSDTADGQTDWFVTADRSTAQSDGNGGAYFLYARYEGGAWPINKLQHIASDGSVEFAGEGINITSGAGIDGINGIMISDGGTGVVVVCQDETPAFDMDLYMQYFDDLTASAAGGGGAGAACTKYPAKLDLPPELNVLHQDGRSVVELRWDNAQARDAATANKIQIFFDYLKQSPTPELDGTGKILKGIFTRHMYEQIYDSGDDGLINAFEDYLRAVSDSQGKPVLDILNSIGIGQKNDYFSDWWAYLTVDKLKNSKAVADIFMSSVSSALKPQPLSYKQFIGTLLKNLLEIKKSPQESKAAQCVSKVTAGLTLDDFVPGKKNSVYGKYDKQLKDSLAKIKNEGSIGEELNALKADQNFMDSTVGSLKSDINALLFSWANNYKIQSIIDFYQTDSAFQEFKDVFFKTDIVKKIESCLKEAYKLSLMQSVNDARFDLIQKTVKQNEVCDEDTSGVLLEAIERMMDDPGVQEDAEKMVLKYINELLNVEKSLSGATAYKDTFSDYYNAHYNPVSQGTSDDLTLMIYRDGKLIHTIKNPVFTSYIDETVPLNTTGRVKNHKYYLVTQTACESKTGSTGNAYINPELKPGTGIDVDADIKVKIKKGYDILFMEKLQALVQAAKKNNKAISASGQITTAPENNGTLSCFEAGVNLSNADINSDNVMNYILACHGGPELSSKLQAKRLNIIPPLLIALKLNDTESDTVIIDQYMKPVIEELNSELTDTTAIFKLVDSGLAKLDLNKNLSEFSDTEKELIMCAGIPKCSQDVKDKVEAYFKDNSHAAELSIQVYDSSGNQVYQTNGKTNIFGEIENMNLGQFSAGAKYTIKIKLANQSYVLPKVSAVTLNAAEPKTGGGYKAHLNLAYDRQFRYGNFDESNDVIDINDILAWGKLISEQPELWNESNLDGLYGVDLLDVITFQQNWGKIQESQIEEDQITLMELANIFGLVSGIQTKVQAPDWLSLLKLSCGS
ncbi:hypothetical protein KJ657_02775 [Patescibacteria group bacterium]|nr:hypothetical protein [Patescibacteria group bacterium]MBU1015991.1 hypothetical protein [Patescibacteria group bacterium]MBU1684800.1 hypothetical protein [Patescibacteria group bacterium]MBU1938770.1 hypothetical protein [Patescibacteria group bacterium]